jgi:SAM-dependent methyltransferase
VADHLGSALLGFIDRWLPPPPARLLDVGCGDGRLTRRLRTVGYESVGLDPDAPFEAGFLRLGLEELRCSEPFDAAVAIRSLHHVDDVDRAVAGLARCLPPAGRLVVFEFAVENVTDATEWWLNDHALPLPVAEAHRNEILTFAAVDAALARFFIPLAREPATYLAREADRPDLEPEEEDAIRAAMLPASGIRSAYELNAAAAGQ